MKNDLHDPAHYLKRLDYDAVSGCFPWKGDTSVHSKVRGKLAGTVNSNGYRVIAFDHTLIRVHRLVWLIETGSWPTDMIDHINGYKDDNRIGNLRECTNTQNQWNTQRRTLGLKGAQKLRNGRWRASILVDDKNQYLGYFDTAEEASAAFYEAARKLHGEFYCPPTPARHLKV
jgi:HNH endonuclease